MAEQSFMLTEHMHPYALQYPSNDSGEFDHQISDDNHFTSEDATISTSISNPLNNKAIKIAFTTNNSLLVSTILEHWEPPK